MKKYFRLLSLVIMFILVLSIKNNFVYAGNVQNKQIDPIPLNEINYEVNKNLYQDQIHERFEEINSSYVVNEPFSKEDSEFIRAYASLYDTKSDIPTVQNIDGSEYFNKYKASNGLQVRFHGTLYSNTKINSLNHSYRGNVTAYVIGTTKAQNIKLTVTNVDYGLVGGSGFGIVYNGSISDNEDDTSSYSMDRTIEYSGMLVSYTYTNAYALFKTPSGSFDLY